MANKRRKTIKTFENRAFWEDFPVKKYRHDAYFKLNMQDLDFAREFFTELLHYAESSAKHNDINIFSNILAV